MRGCWQRGVTAESAAKFSIRRFESAAGPARSPTWLVAARLADAIQRGERVAIFGDYDVDGATSSALLKRFLAHFDVAAEIYIPDRIFEGYGPNPEAMRELASRGATVIVTVDCGTNSAASIDAAKTAGADVVVLDHHQVGGALPDAVAVVNPNREDDLSGQGHLCAAGVTFLALVQVARELRARGRDAARPARLSRSGGARHRLRRRAAERRQPRLRGEACWRSASSRTPALRHWPASRIGEPSTSSTCP